MAYHAQIVRAAQQKLASDKADRESQNQQRLHEVYAQEPRIRKIDMQLQKNMILAAQSVFAQGLDAQEAFAKIRQTNLALQEERQALLREHFPEGYLDEAPICAKCGGSGYIGTAMCSCLLEYCRREQQRVLTLLTDPEQRFENFRLDVYPEEYDSRYGASPRQIMERTFSVCHRYAQTFGEHTGNLLFVGGTGLGKTFLSACIAAVVAEKGYSVAYESASHLFSKLEKQRFNPDETSYEAVEQLRGAQLLIVDDLGTELPGQFVTAALYTLINDRLLERKPTVISTNLTVEEIAQRYSPQIASRMQGSYQRLTFVGKDIRILKNRGI